MPCNRWRKLSCEVYGQTVEEFASFQSIHPKASQQTSIRAACFCILSLPLALTNFGPVLPLSSLFQEVNKWLCTCTLLSWVGTQRPHGFTLSGYGLQQPPWNEFIVVGFARIHCPPYRSGHKPIGWYTSLLCLPPSHLHLTHSLTSPHFPSPSFHNHLSVSPTSPTSPLKLLSRTTFYLPWHYIKYQTTQHITRKILFLYR